MRQTYFIRVALLIGAITIANGCATNRGVIDLAPTQDASTTISSNNVAATAPAVYIASIRDARIFALKPSEPSTPSLKDGQIDNPEITLRAIARKRNGYGKALGDILLPEGETVPEVIRDNLVMVLTEKGYRVVATPGEGASTLDVVVEKFWSWFTPGFWAAKIEFKSQLQLTGELAGDPMDVSAQGYAHQRHQAASGGAWNQTM